MTPITASTSTVGEDVGVPESGVGLIVGASVGIPEVCVGTSVCCTLGDSVGLKLGWNVGEPRT